MVLGIAHHALGEPYSRHADAARLRTFMWEVDRKKRAVIGLPGAIFPEGQNETLNRVLRHEDHHVLTLRNDAKLTFAALLFGVHHLEDEGLVVADVRRWQAMCSSSSSRRSARSLLIQRTAGDDVLHDADLAEVLRGDI